MAVLRVLVRHKFCRKYWEVAQVRAKNAGQKDDAKSTLLDENEDDSCSVVLISVVLGQSKYIGDESQVLGQFDEKIR